MSENGSPLSDEERAELERLRAEKATRDRAAADAAKRAELERLRREQREAERDERDARRREQARDIMEPDEDLKMPLAQKLVLLFVAIIIGWFVVYVLGGQLMPRP